MTMLVRVLRSAPVTLTQTFTVDETPTDASTGVTVTVRRLDGTSVASGPATHTGTGVYSYTVAGQPEVDSLIVSWVADSIAGSVVTLRDLVEVVGGFMCSLSDLRNRRPALDPARWTTAELAEKRIEAEHIAEAMTGQAWVTRFGRRVLSGTGQRFLSVPDLFVSRVRAVSIGGTALSSLELAGVYPEASGVLDFGYAEWPRGFRNIVVEYEYGHEFTPPPLTSAVIKHIRSLLSEMSKGVPERAVSWQSAEGGTYRISLPDAEHTGLPDVDATYARYYVDGGGFA